MLCVGVWGAVGAPMCMLVGAVRRLLVNFACLASCSQVGEGCLQ